MQPAALRSDAKKLVAQLAPPDLEHDDADGGHDAGAERCGGASAGGEPSGAEVF